MSPEDHPEDVAADGGEQPVDGDAAPDAALGDEAPELTMDELLIELDVVSSQRDDYLALAQAKQAEFENFRKRMVKQQGEDLARSSAKLVEELLPVLDAFDYGVAHGDESVLPLRSQLLGALERQGLTRLDPVGEAFDPNEHEAVAHEPGDGGEPVVAESLRAGYRWQGHLLRPVMVRVRD